jgi:hypothetical protein
LLSTAPPLDGGKAVTMTPPGWTVSASLSGRRQAVRRRRFVLHVRDWLGITLIAGFSLTLFAVTLFSLLGR